MRDEEVLRVATWNVRMAIGVASQTITVLILLQNTLSKHRVDMTYLSDPLSHRTSSNYYIWLRAGALAILRWWLAVGEMAIIISEKVQFSLIVWKEVNEHMTCACFKGKFCNISVISVISACTPN